ncbi:MAG: hypothetical protein HQL32_01940 [Planctomycetes bacterium]|nr:hypothetical protein [Planctomycetota bacterium]
MSENHEHHSGGMGQFIVLALLGVSVVFYVYKVSSTDFEPHAPVAHEEESHKVATISPAHSDESAGLRKQVANLTFEKSQLEANLKEQQAKQASELMKSNQQVELLQGQLAQLKGELKQTKSDLADSSKKLLLVRKLLKEEAALSAK